ncbi:PREDICTED: fatty-acid amide hydrolase 2-like [Polistes dominula]|uniref:Fatty-acid amide hydrolase 2-like n=1 Tax=Polistes dominula TaxID=743375 RepID=A0ABM1IMR4_POLDO|nr:PREDICTED: fatty-acid amide hydrolase 2-like [Polistes dominula]
MCTAKVYTKKHVEPTFMKKLNNFILSLLKCLFIEFHSLFDYVVTFIFELCYGRHVSKIPPVTNPLLLESASKLAEKIRSKEIKAEVVVKAFIERCKEVDKYIHAIVEDRFKEAIEDAKQIDFELDAYKNMDDLIQQKPFLGVPYTTKESIKAEGLLHTMGMLNRKNHRSNADATVVHNMRRAGGILIAKTNVPELNQWVETRNILYGQTCNPYNTTRTVGGSSGGEGAIIASCGSAISIGSDIGGSTRLPAFYNGVFGLKPSEGVTSLKGVGLRNEYYPESMAEVGPICKFAEDLTPMLKVLVGEKISMLKLDDPVDVTKLRIFYQKSSGDIRTSRVCSSMRSAFDRTVKHFEEITKSPATKIKIPGSEYSFRLWRYWMTQEKADFKIDLTNGKSRADAVEEIKKLLFNKSDITFPALLKLIDADLLPKENPEWARNLTVEIRQYLLDILGRNGVLIYPSAPFPAVHHYSSFLRPYNFSYFALFNVLKFPAIQIPLGLDYDGLPLGIQVIAAPYHDHLCIAVAKELETAFGGWVQPPP